MMMRRARPFIVVIFSGIFSVVVICQKIRDCSVTLPPNRFEKEDKTDNERPPETTRFAARFSPTGPTIINTESYNKQSRNSLDPEIVVTESLRQLVKHNDSDFDNGHNQSLSSRTSQATFLPDLLQVPPLGDVNLCPCLHPSQSSSIRGLEQGQSNGGSNTSSRNEAVNLFNSYGYGCHAHDLHVNVLCKHKTPVPGWCYRDWCWVDPNNCQLMHKPIQPNTEFMPLGQDEQRQRYYSYATCRNADRFTQEERYSTLAGKTLRIALNSNSGGWMGAYYTGNLTAESPSPHFQTSLQDWTGPVVQFVLHASKVANFEIELMRPPAFLRPKSDEYFDSTSSFDYCVYATALGFLDFCVAQYTVTDRRGTSTDFAVFLEDRLVLVTQDESSSNENSAVGFFAQSLSLVLAPFTPMAWLFIFVIVVPIMGLLLLYHEYGTVYGSFPSTRRITRVLDPLFDDNNNEETFERSTERSISPVTHVLHALYYGVLTLMMEGSLWISVYSLGAKIHLLGMAFMSLGLYETYAANLAAILTEKVLQVPVSSLEDAIRRGYRLCAERKVMDLIISLHGTPRSLFVKDPRDGKPGFKSRKQVLDQLDVARATAEEENGGDSSSYQYCHAAITYHQDLQVEQGRSQHCDKFIIPGPPLGTAREGLPVFERSSPELISLFNILRFEGVLQRILEDFKPQPQCHSSSSLGAGINGDENENIALSIPELGGIWFITFSLALIGLLLRCIRGPVRKKYFKRKHQDPTEFSNHQERQDALEIAAAVRRRRALLRDRDNGDDFVSNAMVEYDVTQRQHQPNSNQVERADHDNKYDVDFSSSLAFKRRRTQASGEIRLYQQNNAEETATDRRSPSIQSSDFLQSNKKRKQA